MLQKAENKQLLQKVQQFEKKLKVFQFDAILDMRQGVQKIDLLK